MAIARYKYAASSVEQVPAEPLAAGQRRDVVVDLEGSAGMLFRVTCLCMPGATRGARVEITHASDAAYSFDSYNVPVMALRMPVATAVPEVLTFPVMLPEVAPQVRLSVLNESEGTVFISVSSRSIEGVEVA